MIDLAIPNLTGLRNIKEQYRTFPIDESHPLHGERIVSLAEFGVKGTSYYSQPNNPTGAPVPGVKSEAFVRYSVAIRVEAAKNQIWESESVKRLLDGRAELIVRDALRSLTLQQHLFDVVWPQVLKDRNPDWDEDKIRQQLPKVIARPVVDPSSPAPHMTGAAVDVDLVLEDGSSIDFGHDRGNMDVGHTEYHEGYNLIEEHPINPAAQKIRRALYWAMAQQGLTNHPNEWWHYCHGDQMWALFQGNPAAIYGAVEHAPDLINALQ